MSPGIEPSTSWFLVGFVSAEPRQELLQGFLKVLAVPSVMRVETQLEVTGNSGESHHGSSCRGSAVTNLTSIHEDAGSIPGLVQWVKDPA